MSQDVSAPAVTPDGPASRSQHDYVRPMAIGVTLVAFVVRIAFLGNQSYWGDELFSLNQAAGDLRHVFDAGLAEIHTPLYATLLWGWVSLGGTATLWTHALSGLFGLLAVGAAYVHLRTPKLSSTARWIAVAATAANGFGIVYSQESRPYALVLLGATGLTAVTIVQVVARPQRPARAGAVWLGWALLTATAHLLGAVLVAATALLLAGKGLSERRYRLAFAQLGLAVAAVLPQLAWIISGLGRPRFAAGTSWIEAPGAHDAWTLLTTVFSSGELVPLRDGFAWTSATGVAVAAVLLVLALFAGRGVSPADWDGDAGAGLTLFLLAAAILVTVLVASHWIHIWTLRNMIVLTPALTWGVAWMIVGSPRQESVRQIMGVAILVALLVSMAPLAASLRQPYKTDWRGLLLYLERERALHPSATFSFFGGGPKGAFLAADRGRSPASLQHIYDHVDLNPFSPEGVGQLRRIPGPQVVVYYASIAHPRPPEIEQAIQGRLRDPGCRPVPVYGFIVVECGTSGG